MYTVIKLIQIKLTRYKTCTNPIILFNDKYIRQNNCTNKTR